MELKTEMGAFWKTWNTRKKEWGWWKIDFHDIRNLEVIERGDLML